MMLSWLDLLHANHIFLDLNAYVLLIDDEQMVMAAPRNHLASCKVVVAEDVNLQGLSETLVPVELKGMIPRGLVKVLEPDCPSLTKRVVLGSRTLLQTYQQRQIH